MTYQLVKQIRDDQKLRESFFELAEKTFEISFRDWYQKGYWTDKYIPYCFVDKDKVIANVSVNLMRINFNGQKKQYVQIGTVMTEPEYQGQGLAKQLLETVLSEWSDSSGIYLFGNDSVLNFYPQFGFIEESEYQQTLKVTPTAGDFIKLDMNRKTDKKILISCYQKGNPFAKLTTTDNYGLLMFYCDSFMNDCLYYSAKYQTVLVAIQNNTNLECLDIFGDPDSELFEIINSLASSTTRECHLGFTAKMNLSQKKVSSDETLFIYQNGENIFQEDKLMWPLLSHA